ncbi:MAG: hypothetical protein ACI8QD_001218 [Cyclobacteriaceae bacterium]|jgi:hypothetical protein
MKNLTSIFSILVVGLLAQNCSSPTETTESEDSKASAESAITLSKAPESEAYETSSLSLKSFSAEKGDAVYTALFDFEVSNYELGIQTPGADTKGIANSGKGQHIHLILNNGPYSAHYDPAASKQLEEGNYVALAFLSRSFHESVKNPNAFWVDVITVGEPAEELIVDFTAKHLFYSRPKGTYSGKDTQKLMIDFYLLNTELSPAGDKIRATVNNEVFIIDEWAPFYVEGLPLGEVKIVLELIDANGQVIPGPFNVSERTVKLIEAEA